MRKVQTRKKEEAWGMGKKNANQGDNEGGATVEKRTRAEGKEQEGARVDDQSDGRAQKGQTV